MDVQAHQMTRVELAAEGDFRLGTARVSPSTRQLAYADTTVTLEPRVMQLLVVLGKARGDVVSRDELMLRCWDGVVVGDNAINRVVSLLRSEAAATGGLFEIETIKKVGYRLVTHGAVSEKADTPEVTTASMSRRTTLISAGAAVALVGGGVFAWRRQNQPSPIARQLYNRGAIAQRQGLSDQTEQAIAFFTEAVKIEPGYADAWGALAISYRHKLVDDYAANPATLIRLIDGAAGRALSLDPDNADAQVARLLMRPNFGHWGERERAFRSMLGHFPDHWLLRGSTGRLMYEVGRWSAGVPLFQANVAKDPFLPISRLSLGNGLWGLGRLQEAEQTFRETLDRWPKHENVWISTFYFLALSGQPGAALMLASNRLAMPSLPTPFVDRNVAWARALDSGKASAVASSVDALVKLVMQYPDTTPSVSEILAALGVHDQMFAAIDRYFGVATLPPSTDRSFRRSDWRDTAFLFSPPLGALRSDSRFTALTARIGLDRYWIVSKTHADRPILA